MLRSMAPNTLVKFMIEATDLLQATVCLVFASGPTPDKLLAFHCAITCRYGNHSFAIF